MARYLALVPAAGLGARIGAGIPKQYLEIAGRPVLWHTLQVLCEAALLTHVWVVLSRDDGRFDQRGLEAFAGKLTAVRCGGATRAESVLNGLRAMQADVDPDDWVLVHDAARPCLTAELIRRLVAEVGDDSVGGILAVPVADTIKRANRDGRIAGTQDRADLWAAQTPQMFRHRRLLEALSAAPLDAVTDEASALERLGDRPRLVLGATTNIKITYPQDLAMAGLLLAQRDARGDTPKENAT